MFCTNCGQELPIDARFCSSCGAEQAVNQESSEPPFGFSDEMLNKLTGAMARNIAGDVEEGVNHFLELASEERGVTGDVVRAALEYRESIKGLTSITQTNRPYLALRVYQDASTARASFNTQNRNWRGDTDSKEILLSDWHTYVEKGLRGFLQRTSELDDESLDRIMQQPGIVYWLDWCAQGIFFMDLLAHGQSSDSIVEAVAVLMERHGEEFVSRTMRAGVDAFKEVVKK